MHFSFRGLRCLALFFPLSFWAIAVLVMLSIKSYEPDPIRAGAGVLRSMAVGFALGAVATWLLSRYRGRGRDDLAEIPLRFWHWIWGALALAAFAASFFPAVVQFINDHPTATGP